MPTEPSHPSPEPSELAARLRETFSAERMLATAKDLVSSPSVNPPGDERAVAAVVRAKLEELSVREVSLLEAAERRVSVTGRWGRPGGRVLAWNGHIDVVPTGAESDWTRPPFEPYLADGRLYGRGSVDMKGSVACALAAIETIAAAGLSLDGELLLLIGADEETGGHHGAAYLLEQGLGQGVDAAICGEGTDLDLFVAAKGLLWLELVVRGRSSHASRPELGTNAVAGMGRVLALLEGWRPAVPDHPLLGAPTLAPTMVQGGLKENLIPDECRLRIDRRLLPGETSESAIAELETLLEEARREGIEVEVNELSYWAPSEIDAEEEIVAVARRAVIAGSGREPAVGGTTGATDARHLINTGGIPTLLFGPGSIDQAHTVDEWVEVEQLELATVAFALVFCDYLGCSPAAASRRA